MPNATAPTSSPDDNLDPIGFASAWLSRQFGDIFDEPMAFDVTLNKQNKVDVSLRPTAAQYPQAVGSLGRTNSSLEWLLLVAVRKHKLPVRGVFLRIEEPPGFVATAPPRVGEPARRIGRAR